MNLGLRRPNFADMLDKVDTSRKCGVQSQRLKLEAVADFVDAGMAALAKVFDGIETDEERNQACAGVAYQISIVSREAAFSGGEFTVKSPLAKDELDQLFQVRQV